MARRPLLITRGEYEANAGPNIGKARWHKPEVRPLAWHGANCLVKDYRRCPWFWRVTYGRAMVRREQAIYSALEGLAGIPRFLGRIDGLAFVIERIEARELGTFPPGGLPDAFLLRLAETVRAMHERGVLHGDLRQRRNILVGSDGRPWLLDFASGIRLSPDFPLFRLLRNMDLSAVAKLRLKHEPEKLTERERNLIDLDRFRPLKLARLKRRRRKKLELEQAR